MRTLLLLLACVGLGFGLAKFQHDRRVAGMVNVMGTENVQISDTSDTSPIKSAIEKQSKQKGGRIEVVNGADLDFGLMMAGTKRAHKFIFKNVGDGDARIWFQSSTCKCTVGNFKEATLKPGEETDVELEWKAESNLEEFSQTATVGSDCINQEEIKLSIHGRIGQSIVFDPAGHHHGDIYSNTETNIPVTIYSFEESPLNLTSAAVQDAILSKRVKVELSEEKHLKQGEIPHMADARHMVEMNIRILPGVPGGPLNISAKLAHRSDRPDQEEVEFLVYDLRARCITPVRVIAGDDFNETRNVYTLGTAKSSDGLKKSFMIAIRNEDSANDPNVRITKTIPAQLKATLGEPKISATQRIYPITLEVPPGTEPLEFDGTFSKDFGKIVIETDVETAPQIPIFLKLRITE